MIVHGSHWPLIVLRFVGNSTTIKVVCPSIARARTSCAFLYTENHCSFASIF